MCMLCYFSTSRPEQFSYDREEYNKTMTSAHTSLPTQVEFVHYYDVRNVGPGTLPYASVDLYIPASHKGVHVIYLDSVEVTIINCFI